MVVLEEMLVFMLIRAVFAPFTTLLTTMVTFPIHHMRPSLVVVEDEEEVNNKETSLFRWDGHFCGE